MHIEKALRSVGVSAVLLKGGAYALAGLHASLGRMVSDVDILVPRERLADVETALMMAGWVQTNHDDYDQYYYRTWMHELPPLRHMRRGAILDVHHAIVPLTARAKPRTQRLLQAAQALSGQPGVYVLSQPDMVLHSAAHLFHESEFERGFRGVVDLDALLREFSVLPDFWPHLLGRANVMELEWPLHHALYYVQKIMGTPVPAFVSTALAGAARNSAWSCRLRDAVYLRALLPAHASTEDRWTPLARAALYLRGHGLRMPLHLLLPHLVRKARHRLHSQEKV